MSCSGVRRQRVRQGPACSLSAKLRQSRAKNTRARRAWRYIIERTITPSYCTTAPPHRCQRSGYTAPWLYGSVALWLCSGDAPGDAPDVSTLSHFRCGQHVLDPEILAVPSCAIKVHTLRHLNHKPPRLRPLLCLSPAPPAAAPTRQGSRVSQPACLQSASEPCACPQPISSFITFRETDRITDRITKGVNSQVSETGSSKS